MELRRYLFERRESGSAFAERSGVKQRTVNNICHGLGCNAGTALRVIQATEDQPTADGDVVTLEDLVVDLPELASG